MIDVNDITEVQRLRLEPGDRLIVRANQHHISEADAAYLKDRVRAILALPDDVPVLVLGAGMSVELVNPA